MLTQHAKFRFEDKARKNNFIAEVNWDENDPNTNDSKIIKFQFPNGDVSFVKREDLNQFLFVIGTQEDQIKMIPQKLTTVRTHEGLVTMKAKKRIEKGEDIISAYSIVCDNVIVKEKIGSIKK